MWLRRFALFGLTASMRPAASKARPDVKIPRRCAAFWPMPAKPRRGCRSSSCAYSSFLTNQHLLPTVWAETSWQLPGKDGGCLFITVCCESAYPCRLSWPTDNFKAWHCLCDLEKSISDHKDLAPPLNPFCRLAVPRSAHEGTRLLFSPRGRLNTVGKIRLSPQH
jgi:hypothetical protein